MKITQKLPLFFLVTGLVPMIGVGVFSYFNTQRALSEQINIQINNTAARQAARVEELVRKDQEYRGLFPTNISVNQALEAYKANPSPKAQAELNRTLADTARFDTRYRRIHLLDLNGKIIGSTDRTFLDKEYAQSEVFAKRADGPSAWNFFRDADGNLALYLFGPIVYADEVIGYALLETPIEHYLRVTDDYSDLGQTGELLLLRRLDSGVYQYQTPARFNENLALTTYRPDGARDYRDHRVVSVRRDIPGTPLAIEAKIDYDEVYQPLATLRNGAIVIVAVTTVAVMVVGFYLARRIIRPLLRFTAVVQKIEGGNLAARVPVETKDEIGALGTAFNNMTGQLVRSYQVLDQKVKDRTKELAEKVHELGLAKAKDDAILGSIGDGMVVTDNTGKILLVNALAANLLGVDKANVVGMAHLQAYQLLDEGGKPIPTDDVPIQLALSSGQKVVQDVQAIGWDGKRSLAITATPVIENGAVIGAVQTIRDITQEKDIDRMKTEFISLASHQLRTPLSAIKWFGEMLYAGDAGELSPEQKEFTKNMVDSTQRMIDLVNSLLNISRIESGRIIVDPKPTDLRELINGIIYDLKGKTQLKNQRLAVSVHPELPMINLDPHLIGQVFLNLLTNAIKYTPEGGEISVVVSRQGESVVAQVSDTGYGIPKAQQARVFQKFFRADNIIKVEADGTGLGLYLVKAVIESSGGKIWFRSEEGKGTSFWFSLPMSGMQAKAGEVTLGS